MAISVPAAEIRKGVQDAFDAVAQRPDQKFRFAVGPALARGVGYPDEVLASFPPAAFESFTGLAYLHSHLAVRPGEAVLDVGSGTGLDAIVAARAVAPTGSVTGLDFAEAMVGKATRIAAASGTANVRFVRGIAEEMPFPARHFDALSLNGLLNLSPEKPRVVAEMARVLKPGGRALVAEISFSDPLPATEVQTVTDWFR